MGLALPAPFFIGILIVIGRLSRDGEIDAMMAAGSGLPQLVRPLVAASLVLVVANVVLVGFLQPYSRYAYRAAVQAVTNASFLTLLRPNVFTTVERTTAHGRAACRPTRRSFDGVFLFTKAENGDEVAITAQHGTMRSSRSRRSAADRPDQGCAAGAARRPPGQQHQGRPKPSRCASAPSPPTWATGGSSRWRRAARTSAS